MSWKTIAIIFIILFIAETITVGALLYVGLNVINKENSCKMLCYEKDADSFVYEEGLCRCWKDNAIFYEERK